MFRGMRLLWSRSLLMLVGVVFSAVATSRGHGTSTPSIGLEVALRDAYALAGQYPGAQVVRIVGNSMKPFFHDGAVLVLRPVSPGALRPGLMAAYTNRFGETIVHCVVKSTAEGWQVKGYDNHRPDSTPLTPANLKGAVYAIFHPLTSTAAKNQPEVARLLAMTPEVLAAPAR